MDILRSSFGDNLTSANCQNGSAIATRTLSVPFAPILATSIHQELLSIRMDAAAHSLQMGKSIKEVAKEVGFDDYYYFLKTFKRLKGMTPASFQHSFHALIADSGVRAAQRMREAKRGKRPI